MVGYGDYGRGAVFYDEGGEKFAYGTGEGLSGRGKRMIGLWMETLESM